MGLRSSEQETQHREDRLSQQAHHSHKCHGKAQSWGFPASCWADPIHRAKLAWLRGSSELSATLQGCAMQLMLGLPRELAPRHGLVCVAAKYGKCSREVITAQLWILVSS